QVERRWKSWMKRRPTQSQYIPQLEWESHVIKYVDWVYGLATAKGEGTPLKLETPFLGPRFVSPSYLQEYRRSGKPDVLPETAYMKALTVVHPLYFEGLLKCPCCDTVCTWTNPRAVYWSGWTTTGHWKIHGLEREETAIGYQLRCTQCGKDDPEDGGTSRGSDGSGTKCYSTTNYLFWERCKHWRIPREYSLLYSPQTALLTSEII
ncbi:hypothetical protein BV20DRAFT_948599, partial [Pilatotrama ljubarskyi]